MLVLFFRFCDGKGEAAAKGGWGKSIVICFYTNFYGWFDWFEGCEEVLGGYGVMEWVFAV